MTGDSVCSRGGARQRAGHRCLPQLELGSLGAPRDWTLGLQHDTCQNSLVRKVTVLINIHSTEQLFSTCGILSFGKISLPTASIFLSPDRAISAASQGSGFSGFWFFLLCHNFNPVLVVVGGVFLLRFLLIMPVK